MGQRARHDDDVVDDLVVDDDDDGDGDGDGDDDDDTLITSLNVENETMHIPSHHHSTILCHICNFVMHCTLMHPCSFALFCESSK